MPKRLSISTKTILLTVEDCDWIGIWAMTRRCANVVVTVVETEAVLLHITPLEITMNVLIEVMAVTVAMVVVIILLVEVTEAMVAAAAVVDIDRLVEVLLLQNTAEREAVVHHLVLIDDLKRDRESIRVN